MRFHLLYIGIFVLLIVGKALEEESSAKPAKTTRYGFDNSKSPTWKNPENYEIERYEDEQCRFKKGPITQPKPVN